MTVNTGGTPMDYALELVGPGITISNVTFTGANAQIGIFDGSTFDRCTVCESCN